jgi:hypothetical protein
MNELRKEVGKYFLDISKLVFAGLVLASVLKIEDINKIWILIAGSLVTLIFAIIGFIILNPTCNI